MLAFIIWAVFGCVFIGLGIYSFFAKKPTGFWSNVKTYEISDVRHYNIAMGKLWCVFGLLFIVLGLPLLDGQNSPLVLLSVIGCMVWAIAMMVIYEVVICRKYRKKKGD